MSVAEKDMDLLFETVTAFRLGLEGMAGDCLARFLAALEPALRTMPAAQIEAVGQVLSQILAAQQRQDLVDVADRLYYELAPLLTTEQGAGFLGGKR